MLFLGLAFLDGNQLTIDVDDRRMSLKAGSVPPDSSYAPASSKAGSWGWGTGTAGGSGSSETREKA